MPLAAANRTAFPKIVIGKISSDIGETANRGLNSRRGAKGSESAMHIRAFESAPPKPPA